MTMVNTSGICLSATVRHLALLLLGFAVGVTAQETPRVARSGTVSTSILNVRARPGTNYEVIAKLKRGDQLQVFANKAEWLEVAVPPHAEAWLVARFIDAGGKVTADRVRVHSGPGIVFSHYGLLDKNQPVRRRGEPTADGWQKIEPPAGLTAWVNAKFVALDAAPGGASPVRVAPAAGQTVSTPGPETTVPAPATPVAPAPAETVVPALTETVVPAPMAPAVDAVKSKPAAPATPAEPEDEQTVPAIPASPAPAASAAGAVKPEPASPATPAEPEGERAMPEPTPAVAAKPDPALASPLPLPAAEEARPGSATPSTPAAIGDTVMREGILSSLRNQGSRACTHLLSVRVEDTLYPVCFLVSSKVALEEWEGQKVRVHGREIWYPGWKRPVIGVIRVQRLTP